jgi:hypothetical protein
MSQSGRWVLDWQDQSRDPDHRIVVSADSVDEFRERVRHLLEGYTSTPDDAEDFKGLDALPAIDVFQEDLIDLADDAEILGLWSGVSFECDDGLFYAVRER